MKSFRLFCEERINLHAFNLPALYQTLNGQLFDGELPYIPVSFGKTPKGAAGVTTARASRPPGRGGAMFRRTIPGTIAMIISPHVYEEDVLKGLVVHEMIHVWCLHFDKHERDSHGAYFLTKRAKVQAKVSFTIPLKHATEDDEHGAPREVSFIAAIRTDGTKLVELMSKLFTSKPDSYVRASAACDAAVAKRSCRWAAYGVAKSPLANTLSVARDLGGGTYKLDSFKLLGVQRILYVNGAPDFS